MKPDLEKRVADLENKMNQFTMPDRYYFPRDIEMFNGKNIKFGTSIGTKLGASNSKLGLFGVSPVAQQSAISAPSGGSTISAFPFTLSDTQARAAINSIIAAIKNIGITL